jgi:copper transport protein
MGFEEAFRDVAFTVVRLTAFLGNALIFGLVPISLLVIRPAFSALDESWNAGRAAVAERIEGLVQAGLTASAVATAIGLLLQAILVAEVRGTGLDGSTFSATASTTFGQWWLLRFPLLAALLILLSGRVRRIALAGTGDGKDEPGRGVWLAWGGLGLGLLATSTFSGHAAVAHPVPLSLMNDLLHLVTGSIWLTGIVVLAVILPDGWAARSSGDRIELLAPAVMRFSVVATVAIGVLAITGTVNSLLNVGSLSDLVDTGYGRALAAKVVLFVAILGLGAVNHFVLRHRLEKARQTGSSSDAERTFRRTIAAELAVGLAIMGLTGVLVGLARTRGGPPPASPSSVTTGQTP